MGARVSALCELCSSSGVKDDDNNNNNNNKRNEWVGAKTLYVVALQICNE